MRSQPVNQKEKRGSGVHAGLLAAHWADLLALANGPREKAWAAAERRQAFEPGAGP